MALKYVGPLMVVEDINRSRRFYEQVLGQQVEFDFGENVAFYGGFSIHSRAHFQTLLGEPASYPVISRAHNGELYFEADDMEAILVRLKQYSVGFISEIQEQPWGQRSMRIYDPDGHIIEIGEPMEVSVRRMHGQGLSPEEIVRRTGMPADYVEKVVKGGE